MKKGPIILPNLITAFALSCGLFVIFRMSMLKTDGVQYEQVLASVAILMLAAFLDFIDGAVARIVGAESDFGGVFDALADAVSFGVAPSVIILKTLSAPPKTELSFFLTIGAMLYSIAGILRLVRFRVMQERIRGNSTLTLQAKKYFTGLPIPAAAITVVSTTLFFLSKDSAYFFVCTPEERIWIAGSVFFLIGYLMVSNWKFPSLKSLNIRIRSFSLLFVIACVAVLFLFALMNHFSLLLVTVFWGYIVAAIVLSVLRRVSGRRIKSLQDFDPDEEESSF